MWLADRVTAPDDEAGPRTVKIERKTAQHDRFHSTTRLRPTNNKIPALGSGVGVTIELPRKPVQNSFSSRFFSSGISEPEDAAIL
jgi:hypothetical protein